MEFKDKQSIYLQIADYICEQILLGKWPPGERIPSVRELAGLMEVNPNTVMRTFDFLQNKEIIFAVEYINDNATDSQLFSLDFTSKGRATGLNFATKDLIAAMDTAVDKRKSTTFYFEKAISTWECGKFVSISSNGSYAGNDWVVLRYADVLLMQVEAIMAGSNSTSDPAALTAFKAIRTRAGFDASGITSVTKDDLLKERRLEFAFENQRLYDLIRFGAADAVLGAFSTKGEPTFAYSSTALLLPIPQRERNLNPTLAQNPGYNQ